MIYSDCSEILRWAKDISSYRRLTKLSRFDRDRAKILGHVRTCHELSRPCLSIKLTFTCDRNSTCFAYAFAIKYTVRKYAYATYFLPVSLPLSSSACLRVRVCAYACVHVRGLCTCFYVYIYMYLFVWLRVCVCAPVSFFFLSFSSLIIKVYFMLQSVECADNR